MISLQGNYKTETVTLWELSQLQVLWARDVPELEEYLTIYENYLVGRHIKKDDRVDNIIDWAPPRRTRQQVRLSTMSKTIKV